MRITENQQNASPKSSKARCLVPGCKGESDRRGVCRNCYAVFWRQVKASKTSWKKLENAGLILKSERGRLRSAAGAALKKIAKAGA